MTVREPMWMPWAEPCPTCGADVEVHTTCRQRWYAYPDDPWRCMAGHQGVVVADEDRAFLGVPGEAT